MITSYSLQTLFSNLVSFSCPVSLVSFWLEQFLRLPLALIPWHLWILCIFTFEETIKLFSKADNTILRFYQQCVRHSSSSQLTRTWFSQSFWLYPICWVYKWYCIIISPCIFVMTHDDFFLCILTNCISLLLRWLVLTFAH